MQRKLKRVISSISLGEIPKKEKCRSPVLLTTTFYIRKKIRSELRYVFQALVLCVDEKLSLRFKVRVVEHQKEIFSRSLVSIIIVDKMSFVKGCLKIRSVLPRVDFQTFLAQFVRC